MRTLLDHLSIKLPIWSAGMGGGLAGPELVAAVCEAGGFGVLGAGSAPGAQISAWVTKTRELTSRPFGANIILPMSDGSDVEACFDARVPVLVLFWGDTQPYVKDAHRRGMFVVAQCGGPEDAVAAADADAGHHAHLIADAIAALSFDIARPAQGNWRMSEWPHQSGLGTLCACSMCAPSKPKTFAV